MPLVHNYKNGRWIDQEIDHMPTMTQHEIQAELYKLAEEYSIHTWPAEHRHHLGISVIGKECSRMIWYSFRWVKLIQHDPRMRRLFARGHREEPLFEQFLLWAGFSLRTIDPRTDKQYKLSLLNGHYGGSGDGIALVRWLDDLPVLAEFKTHNNKSFEALKADKVKKAKPEHWVQMCGYGRDFDIKYAVYCAVNKDTDEWYFEFLELDWKVADEAEKRAADIIYTQTPPQRINENPSYFKCKYCDYHDECHHGKPIEKNCRSCINAIPGANASWDCSLHGAIPRDFLVKGCNQWKGIV